MQNYINIVFSAVLPAVVALAGIIIARQNEKLKTMRGLLSAKKAKVYADAFTMFYALLKDVKANRAINNKKALDNMMDLKRDIFMYGSDKVFRSLNSWLLLTNSSDKMAQIRALFEFELAMREDLCHGTKLNLFDVAKNFTQDEEEARKLLN